MNKCILYISEKHKQINIFGAEKWDDKNSFVRKIRFKIMWNITVFDRRRFDFIFTNHIQKNDN